MADRRTLATPGLPEALVGADDQPVRLAGLAARTAARGDSHPRRERLRGRAARHGRVPPVPALRASGGRLGRSAAPQADPRPRRSRAGCGPRIGAARVRLRRSHDLAALCRRLPRRRRHGVLRRRVPVVPALARRPRPARRRQLEARDQPICGRARRPRAGRRSDRGTHRAVRDSPRRRQLPRVGGPHRAHRPCGAPFPSRRRSRACAASSSRGSATCSATRSGGRSRSPSRCRTSSTRWRSRSSSSTRCATSICRRPSSGSSSESETSAGCSARSPPTVSRRASGSGARSSAPRSSSGRPCSSCPLHRSRSRFPSSSRR